MDLTKQYIIQVIGLASNNLRLSSQKIEVVSLLKERIGNSENLGTDFQNMKKITELSKLAIRLNEIYLYLSSNKVDFLKLSEKFRDHIQLIIKDLSYLLDSTNPSSFKDSIQKLNEYRSLSITTEPVVNSEQQEENEKSSRIAVKLENEKLKEKFILEDDKHDDDDQTYFQNFEVTILKPIKHLDSLLKKVVLGTTDNEELQQYSEIMKFNGNLSEKFGSEIIANMHKIFAKALLYIKEGTLIPDKELIEQMRACLIVIVALVRNKEVDIKIYLNRAEEFGKKIQNM
ncbi:MAG TPA: hypothetical protein PK397_05610 [Ignavibacteriaceae bacterium]|nr:hypothetical protein [Ignavibacteriaceae bacterium]